jgi:hypothetical protein
VIRVNLAADEIRVREGGYYDGTYAEAQIGGWTVRVVTSRFGEIQMSKRCPDCDGEVVSHGITDLASYGRLLAGEPNALQRHQHWYEDDTTHPKAPKWEPGPIVAAPIPLFEHRLAAVLRELVRAVIAEEGEDEPC